MARFGIGWLGVVALATVACAGSSGSSKTSSGASTAATAASAENEAKQPGTASAAGDSAGASSAGGATRQVVGRIELLDRANEVTLSGTERVGLAFDQFKIDEATRITLPNGERATVADVSPGDEVRATFSGSGADAHLERLEILPSGE